MKKIHRLHHSYKKFKKNRKNTVVIMVILLLLLIITLLQIQTRQTLEQRAAEESKPNIIVIMTDDQQVDLIGKYMPTMRDTLQKDGITFNHAYAVTPVCCPARAGFLTGLYTHNHGIWQNNPPEGGFETFNKRDSDTLPVWLKKDGYKTIFIGKYMNGYPNTTKANYIPPGWTDFNAITKGRYYDFCMNENGKDKCYGKKQDDYSTNVFKKMALQTIKKTKGRFFLMIATNAPHGDGNPEDDSSMPALDPKYAKNCKDIEKYRPPNFNEEDISDKPKAMQKNKLSKEDIKFIDNFRSHQVCALKSVDDMIGDIVKTLKQEKIYDNTMIIFIGDNGYSVGEHRRIRKGCYFESCTRVPLIISYPKLTKGAQTTDQLALNIDVTATILNTAGITIPRKVNGKSLLPLLKDSNNKIHEGILIETTSPGKTYTIRTDNYKYTELSDGSSDLYDMVKDPFELQNVVKNKEYTDIVKDLKAKLSLLKQNKDIPLISPSSSPSQTITPGVTENPSGKPPQNPTPTSSEDPSPTLTDVTTPEPSEPEPTLSDEPTQPDVQPSDDPKPSGSNSPTVHPGDITFNLLLDGIGSAGDFTNPTQNSLSNKNPKTTKRILSLILSPDGENFEAYSVPITYERSSGTFIGTLPLKTSLSENAFVLMNTENYLTRFVPLSSSTVQTNLYAGDLNGDNQLTILDYNLFADCYTNKALSTCKKGTIIVGDLNDDGVVNEFDSNLLLREMGAESDG